MNGLNGSVAVLKTSSLTTIADPDATNLINNKTTTTVAVVAAVAAAATTTTTTANSDNSMEISTNQIVTELSNEDRYTEHEEYSTGNTQMFIVYKHPGIIELQCVAE